MKMVIPQGGEGVKKTAKHFCPIKNYLKIAQASLLCVDHVEINVCSIENSIESNTLLYNKKIK